jgi:hypothetical protein
MHFTSWITRRSIRFAHRADIKKEALVISGAVVTVSYSREIGKKELGRWVESIAHEPTGGITRRSSIKLAYRADIGKRALVIIDAVVAVIYSCAIGKKGLGC